MFSLRLDKVKSTLFKSLTENKTTICSLLSRHFYYWAADRYLASVFIVSPPGIHISLGICVWGYTYHGDIHITVTPVSFTSVTKRCSSQRTKSRDTSILPYPFFYSPLRASVALRATVFRHPSDNLLCTNENIACGYWFSKRRTTKSIWIR